MYDLIYFCSRASNSIIIIIILHDHYLNSLSHLKDVFLLKDALCVHVFMWVCLCSCSYVRVSIAKTTRLPSAHHCFHYYYSYFQINWSRLTWHSLNTQLPLVYILKNPIIKTGYSQTKFNSYYHQKMVLRIPSPKFYHHSIPRHAVDKN